MQKNLTRYLIVAAAALATFANHANAAAIDRHSLVTRHNVILTEPKPLSPLSLGNGEFAFTADITGLQTFEALHQSAMPLGTLTHWAWHSFPNPEDYRLEDCFVPYDHYGREVPYLSGPESRQVEDYERRSKANAWLRANPHRLDLGRIGLILKKKDGQQATPEDLSNIRQELDLWSGSLKSRFDFDGRTVTVETVCHPDLDGIAVRIESSLLADKRLGVFLAFPYPTGGWREPLDWKSPDRHVTEIQQARNSCRLHRRLDSDQYYAAATWSNGGSLNRRETHRFEILAQDKDSLELVVIFSPEPSRTKTPNFAQVRSATARHWKDFWSTGGAIDLSGSTDPRAKELERRIVLSQYLTAIQCAGSKPPQETGLVTNSWHGKFHLEMHWWHAAHFALWGRTELLEKSLGWYEKIMPNARKMAQLQGYKGVRWPKMVGPEGRESPSSVGVFLIWQQPHPIYYAELLYRNRPDRRTLDRYKQTVFETAEFMASYPKWDRQNERYVLGPPLIPAQESYGRQRREAINPTFELAYWRWGLSIAQQWRERLGMTRIEKWDHIIEHISKPTVRDGVYTAIEVKPYTITGDHPSMVAALGLLPKSPLVNAGTMQRTLNHVFDDWNWRSTWGWDYPMMAMTAARIGEPEKAIDALLIETPKNGYLPNGHNFQTLRLPLYLPGNGGLLYAVAMMAAGWDGCDNQNAPGFPKNGKWLVRWEGLKQAP